MANEIWHHRCDCCPKLAEERHIQKWLREHHQVGRTDDGGVKIKCNECRDVKIVGAPEEEEEKEGPPSSQKLLL